MIISYNAKSTTLPIFFHSERRCLIIFNVENEGNLNFAFICPDYPIILPLLSITVSYLQITPLEILLSYTQSVTYNHLEQSFYREQ
jgi:hypothetical protein